MMMTIKMKSRFSGIGSMLKSLCLGMFLVAGLGFLNSIQAQTPQLLGDDVAKQIAIELQEESTFLKEEASRPGATTSDKVWNDFIITSYSQISDQFTSGATLQNAFLNVLEGNLKGAKDDGTTRSAINLTPSQKAALDTAIQHVKTWNVTSRDQSDFDEALILIRELKNQ